MEILERYHRDLLARSRGIPLFDRFEDPMPVCFGKLHAGTWPSSAPNRAVLEGMLGFLPNMTSRDVAREIEEAFRTGGDEYFREQTGIEFPFRHDCSVLDPDHALPRLLVTSAEKAGIETSIAAMTASCDACLYTHRLKIPTVVFGPGALEMAHARDEHIRLDDIACAAEALARFAMAFCGSENG
jgi:acetylornithine deacetylase